MSWGHNTLNNHAYQSGYIVHWSLVFPNAIEVFTFQCLSHTLSISPHTYVYMRAYKPICIWMHLHKSVSECVKEHFTWSLLTVDWQELCPSCTCYMDASFFSCLEVSVLLHTQTQHTGLDTSLVSVLLMVAKKCQHLALFCSGVPCRGLIILNVGTLS